MNLRKFFGERLLLHPEMSLRRRSFAERVFLHWQILIVAFLVAMPVIFATNFLMYRDISRGEFSPLEKKRPVAIRFRKVELLDKTVNYFETKSATFNQFKKNRTLLVDPSR